LPARALRAVVKYVTTFASYAKQHPLRALGAVALAVVPLVGLRALGQAVSWWVPVGLVTAIGVAALPDKWKAKILELVGSVVVAIVTLVGFNVITDLIASELLGYNENSSKGWILLGLVVGAAVFFAASYAYLDRRGHDWKPRDAVIASGAAAALFIFGLPILYDLAKKDAKVRDVPRAEHVPSEVVVPQLDLFIVAEKGGPSARPDFSRLPALREMDVRFSVGFAEGNRVRWALVDTKSEREAVSALADQDAANRGAPTPRDGSDRALLLVVDGTPPVVDNPDELPYIAGTGDNEAPRWQAVAQSAGLTEVPTYALLQTREPHRFARWASATDLRAMSIQALGNQTVTDTAARLAVAGRTPSAEFALALRHRPVLLFDTREPVPRPLSIEALFGGGKIKQCPLRGGGDDCTKPLTNPAELENGETRLELERPSSAGLKEKAREEWKAVAAEGTSPPPHGIPGRPLSTIYVHPVTREVNGRKRLYLDYWWFLPDNPARAGGGAFCGAGLVTPGISCFDHESDWEGVTVVVDQSTTGDQAASLEPIAVHYAQHNHVVRYQWAKLRNSWDNKFTDWKKYTKGVNRVEEHPLVFVARGTHASYPTPCFKESCDKPADDLEEERHNGHLPWAGNGASTCGDDSACLTLLPTMVGGSEPALWNGFKGPWGKSRCLFKWYCNSTTPPAAPGQQGRYKHPWTCHGRVNLAEDELAFEKDPCLDE
jgi:hypothetical protein